MNSVYIILTAIFLPAFILITGQYPPRGALITPVSVLGGLLVILLILHLLKGYLLARQGRIILSGDRLVEHGLLNRTRVFTYNQIWEAGAYKKSVDPLRSDVGLGPRVFFISYYVSRRDGKIDYRRRREAQLIHVVDWRDMLEKLGQRIAAPSPYELKSK